LIFLNSSFDRIVQMMMEIDAFSLAMDGISENL